MAGRGIDIKLGGNKDFIYDGKKENEKEIKENEKKAKILVVYTLLERNG